jgi:hypothetical protein
MARTMITMITIVPMPIYRYTWSGSSLIAPPRTGTELFDPANQTRPGEPSELTDGLCDDPKGLASPRVDQVR